MRIGPTQTPGASSAPARAARVDGPAPREASAATLWLPPSMRPTPPLDAAPKLIVLETYGRPRTDAEHRYYRDLIAETAALVDAAKVKRAAELDGWLVRITAPSPEAPPPARPAIRGDPEPGLGGGSPGVVHREADGFEVNAPGTEAPALVADRAVIRAGLKAEVTHRKQIGGTCGLYALGMVMDFWHAQDPKHPTALIQAADREPVEDPRGFAHFHHEPTDARYVLDVALERGYTAKGEMYQADLLAETATLFGYEASLRTEATLDDVYRVLDAGHPAIVPFNVDRNGDAGTPDSGARAHYAVLEGYFDHEGERYVIAKHSWSKTESRVWRAGDFFASWDNLKTTKFYGTPGDGEIPDRPDLEEPSRLTLPDAGGGRADISRALGRTLIEVVPPGEPLTGGERVAAQAQGG